MSDNYLDNYKTDEYGIRWVKLSLANSLIDTDQKRIAELEVEVEQLKANQSSVKAEGMITLSEERLYGIVDALFHEFASSERGSARVSLALKLKSLIENKQDNKQEGE